MQIQDAENITAAELVERKAEIIAGLAETSQAVLAARYVQARTDAKVRDEKLADQARTLEALQSGNKAIREQLGIKVTECEELFSQLAEGRAAWAADTDRIKADVAGVETEFMGEIVALKEKVTTGKQELANAKEAHGEALSVVDGAFRVLGERCDRLKSQAELSATNWAEAQEATTTALGKVQGLIIKAQANAEIDKADRGE